MEEFKGTPGPWSVIEHSWSDTSLVSGDKTIATQSIYDEATEDNQDQLEQEVSANFALLAAAPDLLEALMAMTEHLDKIKQYSNDAFFIKNARRAINKALGKEVPGE